MNKTKDNDFIKVSVVKKWTRSHHDMLASKESMEILNALVKATYEKALENAKKDGRKVVKSRDFETSAVATSSNEEEAAPSGSMAKSA